MEQIRRQNPCFCNEANVTTWDTCQMSVFAIRRTFKEKELICIANFSGEGKMACLPTLDAQYEDLFRKERVSMQSVWMAPYQYRWCVRKSE